MRKIALIAGAMFAFGAAPAEAAWMTFGTLHARETRALTRVARLEGGIILGCHVYGRHQLEERCDVDVPVTLAPPLSGYTLQTFAASWIPNYGVFWTAVSPLQLKIFSDSP